MPAINRDFIENCQVLLSESPGYGQWSSESPGYGQWSLESPGYG